MIWYSEDGRRGLFSVGLLGLAMLMMSLTVAELVHVARGADQDSLITKETLDQIRPDKQTAQRYLAQYRQAADKLVRQNKFVPPPSGPEPPGDCSAIFGDEARFGDRWIKVDDTIGEARVLEIGPTAVTLLFDGKRITRRPSLVADKSDRNSSRGRGSRPGNVGKQVDGDAKQVRGYFEDIGESIGKYMRMSPEERRRYGADMRAEFEKQGEALRQEITSNYMSMSPDQRRQYEQQMRGQLEQWGREVQQQFRSGGFDFSQLRTGRDGRN
ncbi:hypothetical protein ACFL02_04595 [Planctomycetota bacterium]